MVLKTVVFFLKLALALVRRDGNAKGTSEVDLSKVKLLYPVCCCWVSTDGQLHCLSSGSQSSIRLLLHAPPHCYIMRKHTINRLFC
ncbi:hypothetical protein P167DRAFT_329286 [Morchella conica CCBAS932]|uniref:Secreted protein n=1 Tax=Morchella conica CCBAS932 TaxID=1392247 RepID=A0A3N4KEF7_9PEZI|nr:hypothetical protein P167DRAFT_329286 [Morchella conica CCBAS932]